MLQATALTFTVGADALLTSNPTIGSRDAGHVEEDRGVVIIREEFDVLDDDGIDLETTAPGYSAPIKSKSVRGKSKDVGISSKEVTERKKKKKKRKKGDEFDDLFGALV